LINKILKFYFLFYFFEPFRRKYILLTTCQLELSILFAQAKFLELYTIKSLKIRKDKYNIFYLNSKIKNFSFVFLGKKVIMFFSARKFIKSLITNFMSKCFNWNAKSSSKPKISEFYSSVLINKQVLRF